MCVFLPEVGHGLQANKASVVHVTAMGEVSGGPLGLNPMQIPQGNGSGFVWDFNGHIITNYVTPSSFPLAILCTTPIIMVHWVAWGTLRGYRVFKHVEPSHSLDSRVLVMKQICGQTLSSFPGFAFAHAPVP